MKKFNAASKTGLLSLLLSLVILAGVAGMTEDPAFAGKKNKVRKILADVEFRIVILGDILTPFEKPRAVGEIFLSGYSTKGTFFEAAGAVFIVIDVIGAGYVPDMSVAPLIAGEVAAGLAGNDNEWRVTGELRDIDLDRLVVGEDTEGKMFVEGTGRFAGRLSDNVDEVVKSQNSMAK